LQKVVVRAEDVGLNILTFASQDVESDVAVVSAHSVVGCVAPCPPPAVAS